MPPSGLTLRLATFARLISLHAAFVRHDASTLLPRHRSAAVLRAANEEGHVVSRRRTLEDASGLLAATAAAALSLPERAFADALGSDQYKSGIRGADPNGDVYQMPDLPYAANSLEPSVSKEAIAYGKGVQAAAVKTLNGFYNGKGKNIAIAKLQAQARGLQSPELREAAVSR